MQEQKIWHAGVLGMTLNVDEGRITIFRSTLETLGWPSHYRFLYNPQMNQIAVQVCSAADAGAHRVGKLNEFSSCEIKCVAFVRMIYKNAKWDKRRSYRMIGNPFPEQRLVSFQIQEALPIENGRVLDETVSPTFALCRAEGSPSQNNPTPEEKAIYDKWYGKIFNQRHEAFSDIARDRHVDCADAKRIWWQHIFEDEKVEVNPNYLDRISGVHDRALTYKAEQIGKKRRGW